MKVDQLAIEDYERLPLLDKMYLQEREREVWEEYQKWIEEQERLPALIEVVMPEYVEEEEIEFKHSKNN